MRVRSLSNTLLQQAAYVSPGSNAGCALKQVASAAGIFELIRLLGIEIEDVGTADRFRRYCDFGS